VSHIYGDRISSQRHRNIIFLHVYHKENCLCIEDKTTVSTSAFSELFLLNSEKSWKMSLSDEKYFIKMNKRKKVKPAKSFTSHPF